MERALRRLKKKVDREGVIRDVRAKRYFGEKPSEVKRRKEEGRPRPFGTCFVPATKISDFQELPDANDYRSNIGSAQISKGLQNSETPAPQSKSFAVIFLYLPTALLLNPPQTCDK